MRGLRVGFSAGGQLSFCLFRLSNAYMIRQLLSIFLIHSDLFILRNFKNLMKLGVVNIRVQNYFINQCSMKKTFANRLSSM